MFITATPTNPYATVTGNGIVPVTQPSGFAEVVVTAENSTGTLTYTINYNIPLSIQEFSVDGLKIYPLPAQDYMMIESGDQSEIITDISVFTVDGRKMLSENRINNSQTRIEFQELKNGIYLIQVNTNKKTYSTKIIIGR